MGIVARIKKKPHVIFVPFPAQSHIKAMLKLAQLLNHRGIEITFVNTEHIHKRLLSSGGLHSLDGSSGFHFENIPDSISRSSEDDDGTEFLMDHVETTFLSPFLELVTKLTTPPTCIISDAFMSVFTVDAAQKLGIPIMLYWTLSACGFMGIYQIQSLIDRGLVPPKDEGFMTNGYLETIIDRIPGMEGIRLKDINGIIRTTDPDDHFLTFCLVAAQNSHNVIHNIFHTFDDLEVSIVNALSNMFPKVYTVGPVQLLLNQIPEENQTEMSNFSRYSLWKEEPECIQWLQSKEPNSVMYVNYGSFAVMSLQDLIEFGWGLANSNHYFLWIIRSNLLEGESAAVLPPELEKLIKKRGFIASWCSQEKVLNHPSVGGFLTHCGWGSTIESLSAGVPMICWPLLWDQFTNCRYICKEWEVGLEMGMQVKREEVSSLVQEVMGERGHKMRSKAIEWNEKALTATRPNGSSSLNVNNLIEEIITLSNQSS